MGDHTRKLARGAGLAALAASLTACDAFMLGNPFLPKANVLIEAEPQTTVMKLTYDFTTGVFQREPEAQSKMMIKPRSGDIMPGVHFTNYTLRFKDNRDQLIDSYLLPEQNLGTAVYIPKTAGSTGGSGASGEGKAIEIPVVSPQLWKFGEENGFVPGVSASTPGWIPKSDPWPQNLTGIVTFYGKDDNGYPIKAEGTFTVKFETSIIPADGN
jgi:hypothetical protein